MIDIERLHDRIQVLNHSPVLYRAPRAGYTTAYLWLMVGEVQLGDRQNCYVYVTKPTQNPVEISRMFCGIVHEECGMAVVEIEEGQFKVVETDQYFFFVTQEYFSRKFAFAGTRVHRVFADINLSGQAQVVHTWRRLESTGTEII